MATPTRFTKLGVAGGRSYLTNTQDSYIKTYEIDVMHMATGTAFDTGIEAPKTFAPVGGWLVINVPESTGLTKTISFGYAAGANDAVTIDIDVSVAGRVGGIKINTTNMNDMLSNFTFMFGSADFAELEATLVLTVMASDE